MNDLAEAMRQMSTDDLGILAVESKRVVCFVCEEDREHPRERRRRGWEAVSQVVLLAAVDELRARRAAEAELIERMTYGRLFR